MSAEELADLENNILSAEERSTLIRLEERSVLRRMM